jgi:hypothetical protein
MNAATSLPEQSKPRPGHSAESGRHPGPKGEVAGGFTRPRVVLSLQLRQNRVQVELEDLREHQELHHV